MTAKSGNDNLPTHKPSLLDYLEEFLPFRIPRIPLPQTAKNLDKAVAKLIEGKSLRQAHQMRIDCSEDRARSRARIQLIDTGAEAAVKRILGGDTLLEQRAIAAAIGDAIEQQEIKERVLEMAARQLERDPPLEDAQSEIDDDWLNTFSSFASRKSREDVQSLWARLLAGEIRKPGSFSLRTLQHLSVVSAEDASFIYRFMQYVIDSSQLYAGENSEFITVDEHLRLEHLGVIHPNSLHYLEYKLTPGQKIGIRLHTAEVIEVVGTKEHKVNLNVSFLTPFGKDLYAVSNKEPPPREYARAIAQNFSQGQCKVLLLTLAPFSQEHRGQAVLKREVL